MGVVSELSTWIAAVAAVGAAALTGGRDAVKDLDLDGVSRQG
jgi:hypothetical protein